MAKEIGLKNIEQMKRLNNDYSFSLYDYIYHEIEISKINTDIYFALLELYWPSFLVHGDYVFLKEKFSETTFKEYVDQNTNIEYWINFLSVDGYFQNDEDGEEKASALSKILVGIWETKLKKEFPHLEFIVSYLEDEEVGDYGLTFYQKKYKAK